MLIRVLCAVLCPWSVHLPSADQHQLAVSCREQTQVDAVESRSLHTWNDRLSSQAPFWRQDGVLQVCCPSTIAMLLLFPILTEPMQTRAACTGLVK